MKKTKKRIVKRPTKKEKESALMIEVRLLRAAVLHLSTQIGRIADKTIWISHLDEKGRPDS